MEDASHGDLDGSVVEIDRFWVVRSAPRAEWLSRSEQGFDGFVAQDEERRHRPETGRQRLVAAGVADSADEFPAPEVLQIISGGGGGRTGCGLFLGGGKPRAPEAGGGSLCRWGTKGDDAATRRPAL